jgi:bisanhydrobacterioruberin hydratase
MLEIAISIFYIGGIFSHSLDLFTSYQNLLTKFILFIQFLLTLATLFKRELKVKQLLTVLLILITTHLIEVLGVDKGYPFGSYSYTNSLGVKFLDVPVLVCAAWLTSICGALAWSLYFTNNSLKVGLSTAIFIILFDLSLEPAARKLNLWHFKDFSYNLAPWQNYFSWGVIGFLLSLVLNSNFKNNINSHLLRIIFFWQVVYFLCI